MADRMLRVFEVIQDDYLREPQYVEVEARHRRVQQLRAERERLAGELWDEANRTSEGLHGPDAVRAALDAYAQAEETVIEREIVGQIPPRMVHESRNARIYREVNDIQPLDPANVDIGPDSVKHWYDRAREAGVTVEPLGDPADSIIGIDPIEDVALAPRVDWSAGDEKRALQEAIRIYGLELDQWIELDWPPTAHLSDSGYVYTTDFEPCEAHFGAEDEAVCDGCSDCQDSVREVVEQPAQWKWTTTLRINEISFDCDGDERDREVYSDLAFEVAVIEQDPRDILIGPPGAGRLW